MFKFFILAMFLFKSVYATTASWNATLLAARGSNVNFALWGGGENINNWIDTYVKTQLKKQYGINLNRIPLTDTQVAIQKLLKEKKLKKKNGSIDLLWVNGENFKTMKDKKLTWKPFLKKLPNSKYINTNDSSLMVDFGVQHEGHESPWGSAQMVFIYDSKHVPNPPKSLAGLKMWIERNPGRFTYSSPPDFTGSAFIRQTFMNLTDKKDYAFLQSEFDKKAFDHKSKNLWIYLKSLKPFLYKRGSYYPESVSKLHSLYSDGKTWITMDYYPTTAQRMIEKGIFPKTTKTFILKEGSLSNTHYVSIPGNASNKTAALVLANFLMSPEAQASKLDPKNWGDFTILDTNKLSKIDKQKIKAIDLGKATLPLSQLSSNKGSELPASYVPHIEKEWKKNILK